MEDRSNFLQKFLEIGQAKQEILTEPKEFAAKPEL
jgi:hypothetical protein